MKIFRKLLLLSLLTISISVSSTYCQVSENSTLTENERAEIVSLCEKAKDEVKILRPALEIAKETVEAAEKALADEKRAGTLTAEQLALRTREVAELREAYEAMKKAFNLKQREVDTYKKALAGAIKKKNFFKTIAKISTTAAVILGAIVVLQNK